MRDTAVVPPVVAGRATGGVAGFAVGWVGPSAMHYKRPQPDAAAGRRVPLVPPVGGVQACSSGRGRNHPVTMCGNLPLPGCGRER
jgi:hypothetical protein